MDAHKKISLEEVLKYQNDDVVHRFSKTYGLASEEALDIFQEVKRWLWLGHLCRARGQRGGLTIDHSLVVIDEMWHNFVLFTREYADFCKEKFGYYIHHAPTTEKEEREHRDGMSGLSRDERIALRIEQKRPQYELVYDELGRETFEKWYLEYPRKYSYPALVRMQLIAVEKLYEASVTSANTENHKTRAPQMEIMEE